jgi:hypothetical protein
MEGELYHQKAGAALPPPGVRRHERVPWARLHRLPEETLDRLQALNGLGVRLPSMAAWASLANFSIWRWSRSSAVSRLTWKFYRSGAFRYRTGVPIPSRCSPGRSPPELRRARCRPAGRRPLTLAGVPTCRGRGPGRRRPILLGPLLGLPAGAELACPAWLESAVTGLADPANCLARGRGGIRLRVRAGRAAGAGNARRSSTVMLA